MNRGLEFEIWYKYSLLQLYQVAALHVIAVVADICEWAYHHLARDTAKRQLKQWYRTAKSSSELETTVG